MHAAHLLILLCYFILPVYLPAFDAADPNGPRFLAMAALNLVAFALLGTDKRYRDRESRRAFFRTDAGMFFSLFLMVTLLSLFSAVNLPEAAMHIARTFTVFVAAWLLFTLFAMNRRLLREVLILVTVLLLADSLTVFYEIGRYIGGRVSSIYDIQSVYTNKNILAAAIFIRLAAPVWLIFFACGWKRILGAVAAFSGILAVFFLSTRAFYIGLALVAGTLAVYAAARYCRAGERSPAGSFICFTGLLVLALLTYTLTQRYLYPKDRDTRSYNKSVVTRVTEIRTEIGKVNQPAGIRLSSWQRTLMLIKEHPWLGVGAGNWKVAVLKYENQEKKDFSYMLHNHNDFTETAAETGIPGGLLFVMIFLAVFYRFGKTVFRKFPAQEDLQVLFPATVGLMSYAVDAFFNYPAARPEIQVLFAFFLAAGASGAGFRFQVSGSGLGDWRHTDNQSTRQPVDPSTTFRFLAISLTRRYGYPLIRIVILVIPVILFSLNFRSLRTERRVQQDDAGRTVALSQELINAGFPCIPNLTSRAEPVAVIKARYAMRDARYRETVTYLLPDHSSPWDGRREYYLSKAYAAMGMADSAAYWLDQARRIKTAGFDLGFIKKPQ